MPQPTNAHIGYSTSRQDISKTAETLKGSNGNANTDGQRTNNEGDGGAGVSVSFFVVLLIVPIVSVVYMCVRYICERSRQGRERERRRTRARDLLRSHFFREGDDDDDDDVVDDDDQGGLSIGTRVRRARSRRMARRALGAVASNEVELAQNNGATTVSAATLDRLADAVIRGSNGRRTRRGYRRAGEDLISSYRMEAVRRDLIRSIRTGSFEGYDRAMIDRIIAEELSATADNNNNNNNNNTNAPERNDEYDEIFVSEEPGPCCDKTIKSLPCCEINSKRWQLFTAGRSSEELNQRLSTCALCLEDFLAKEEVVVLDCEHCYHSSCVLPWLALRASCPTCRRVVFEYTEDDRKLLFSLPPPDPETTRDPDQATDTGTDTDTDTTTTASANKEDIETGAISAA